VKHKIAKNRSCHEIRERIAKSLEASILASFNPAFLDRIETFAAALAVWGTRLNLTAAPENITEVAFHILDSLAPITLALRHEGDFLRGKFEQSHVLDIGSGAGFPGLILAAASDSEFTLYESRHKRASFLSVTAAEMGLSNVTIVCERAAPQSLSPEFDVLTVRAVGDLGGLLQIAAAALRPGGMVVLYSSQSRKLDPALANQTGFVDHRQIDYELKRDSQVVKHSLVGLMRC